MVETVLETIKADLVRRAPFQTRRQAEIALGRYVDGFWNPMRRHSELGYVSPVGFDAAARKTEAVSLH